MLTIITIIVDIKFTLPAIFRWTALLLLLIIVIVGIIKYLLKPSLNYDQHVAVSEIEEENPELGQMLRTSIEMEDSQQIQQKGISPLLAKVLVKQTDDKMQKLDLGKILPWRQVLKITIIAQILLMILVIGIIKSDNIRTALQRLTNPTKQNSFTKISAYSNVHSFRENEPVIITADVHGRKYKKVFLHTKILGEKWKTCPIIPNKEGKYITVLNNRQRSFKFKVTAGDGETTAKLITYLAKPKIINMNVKLQYPKYTNHNTKTIHYGDIKILEGSTINWEFIFNQDLKQVTLTTINSENNKVKNIPITLKNNKVKAKYTIKTDTTKYFLKGIDKLGQSFKTICYTIIPKEDTPPTITTIEPQSDINVTAIDEIPLRFRIHDDFGIKQMGIIISAGEMDEDIKLSYKKIDDEIIVTDFNLTTLAMLEKYPLSINSNVIIYAYAKDGNPNSTRRGISRLISVDIKSFKTQYKEKRQPDGPPPPPMDREIVIKLEEAIKKQREIRTETFKLTEQQKTDLKIIDALIDKEMELEAKVRSLAGDKKNNDSREEIYSFIVGAADDMAESVDILADEKFKNAFAKENLSLSKLVNARRLAIKAISEQKDKDKKKDKKSKKTPPSSEAPKTFSNEKIVAILEKLAIEENNIKKLITQIEKNNHLSQNTPKALIKQATTRQDIAVIKMNVVEEKMAKYHGKTPLIMSRMESIAKLMEQADKSMQISNATKLQQYLQDASQQLDQLARHIKGMSPKHLADTMTNIAEKANQIAENIEKTDPATTNSSQPSKQQMAENAKTMDDWIKQLAKLNIDDKDLYDKLQEINSKFDLNKTAQLITKNNPQNNKQIKEQMQDLANKFEVAKDILTKTGFQRMQTARENAQDLAKKNKKDDKNGKGKSSGEKKLAKLIEELKALHKPELEKLIKKLEKQLKEMKLGNGGGDEKNGEFKATKMTDKLLKELIARLEEMLKNAKLDIPEEEQEIKVPSNYTRLVEQYFKILSDDLEDEDK